MTDTEWNDVCSRMAEGKSYPKIAAELGLSVGSIKSYIHRHPLPSCEVCGKPVVSLPHKRKRRFCSAKCRLAWWNAHPEAVKRGSAYTHICEACGQEFFSHKASSRFCSRQCYRGKGVSV